MALPLAAIAEALDILVSVMVSDGLTELAGYEFWFWHDASATMREMAEEQKGEKVRSHSESYYQIQAAIIKAAAALAGGMPEATLDQAHDEKARWMAIYQERFDMAYRSIHTVLAGALPLTLPDDD
jgi:hypothetical protein